MLAGACFVCGCLSVYVPPVNLHKTQFYPTLNLCVCLLVCVCAWSVWICFVSTVYVTFHLCFFFFFLCGLRRYLMKSWFNHLHRYNIGITCLRGPGKGQASFWTFTCRSDTFAVSANCKLVSDFDQGEAMQVAKLTCNMINSHHKFSWQLLADYLKL